MAVILAVLLGTGDAYAFWPETPLRAGTTTDHLCIERDTHHAKERGVFLGGGIIVHCLPGGLGWVGRVYLFPDWAESCVAPTGSEVDALWRAVPVGTPAANEA